MTTDRAGPKGPSTEREIDAPHSLYWLGPEGFYVLCVVNSAGPWLLTPDTALIPEAPAKPAGDPNG
jgi:hypothetical protein